MKTNTIYCGECAEMMRRHIPDNSIDLTVTSPPYDDLREYNGYTFEFEPIAAELWRVTKPGGVVVWVVADATVNGSETGTSFFQAGVFMGLGFNLHDTMIWRNTKPQPIFNNGRYTNCFHFMFIFTKGKVQTFNPLTVRTKHVGKNRKTGINNAAAKDKGSARFFLNSEISLVKEEKPKENIWDIPNISPGLPHPAPFPEALARDHIISWSNPGDIVLDPMCGSGTTLKMAVEQGRQYIGIDISQEYVELSRKRVIGARIPLPGLVGTVHNKPINTNYYQRTIEDTKLEE